MSHTQQARYPILQIYYQHEATQEQVYLYTSDLTKVKDEDKKVVVYDDSNGSNIYAGVVLSQHNDNKLNAILSIVRTTFLMFLLTMSSIFFIKDSNDLVLFPIERMLITVKRIGENPLEAARMAEDEAVAEQELFKLDLNLWKQLQQEKTYETSILESTILKIGALLAVGFGEAGAEIIAKNIANNGSVQPMIPGKKIMAVFGFIAIRNFIDATQVLSERVMLFTNEIAEVVHQVCDSFNGATNKNLGDCFLIVWKFQDDDMIKLNEKDEVIVKNLKICQNYIDQALVASLKVMSAVKRLSYKESFKKFTDEIHEKFQAYKFYLGFGLHLGWGIEGAIGSEYKIDASYLSPNVNLASRLEYATKQYGCQLLISGQVYRMLSDITQNEIRHLDRVTVKGSKTPMDLYTCDFDVNRLKINKSQINKMEVPINKQEKKIIRVVERHKKIRTNIKDNEKQSVCILITYNRFRNNINESLLYLRFL
eukprot:TRINITY_DN31623_c0_g1_i3.p1 TRINITY_DN31623_c0_g1~~TRINITY_DN31623_c0_g1_i3.p1  ORF type:complete len:481 (-),score=49.52 TRINITY_DN31623_c0_g1_i3:210-1652(-)